MGLDTHARDEPGMLENGNDVVHSRSRGSWRKVIQRRWTQEQPTVPFGKHIKGAIGQLLSESDKPIIAGPWLGEVGFEVLYWIPLLRWCVDRWPELRERFIAVSRGGVRSWYDEIASSYVDVFDLYDQETFARRLVAERADRTAHGAARKQAQASDWDSRIVKVVEKRLDEPKIAVLHPSILYRSLKFSRLLAESSDVAFPRWKTPDREPLQEILPEKYVAVRFYKNALFSRKIAETFACEAVEIIADRVPVVLLNTEMAIDPKHPDFVTTADVVPLGPHLSFSNNLTLQAIAIANASSFVGNYGGLSFVAPNYGVPSFCFWTSKQEPEGDDRKGAWRDLDIARSAYGRSDLGRFVATHCDEAPIRDLLAPAISAASPE